MTDLTVICPYLFDNEIEHVRQKLTWKIKYLLEKDESRIGSDLMYQKLWKKCDPDNIFILHADMQPIEDTWYEDIQEYAKKYPDAGMIGCKLIYPTQDWEKNPIVQSAGGKFNKAFPEHFGSGLDLFSNKKWKEEIEQDKGQYDKVREVAWTTFGGVFIRREVLNAVGDFDPRYEWSYNRDVDYCLEARKKGFKIYQVPISILHYESKDNRRLKQLNPELNQKETRNLQKFIEKWKNTEYIETIDKIIS